MPVDGGEGTEIVTDLASHWFVDVTATGIYYLTSALPGGQLRYHRFADGSDTPVWRISMAPADGHHMVMACLLYTSDAADERSSVDLGGRRIIKKKKIREVNRPSNSEPKIKNTEQ